MIDPGLVDVEGLGVGVQMFQGARFDPSAVDEQVNLVFLQPDYPPELVCRQRTFIDELVERPQRDAQARRSVACAQPPDPRRTHVLSVPGVTSAAFENQPSRVGPRAPRSQTL